MSRLAGPTWIITPNRQGPDLPSPFWDNAPDLARRLGTGPLRESTPSLRPSPGRSGWRIRIRALSSPPDVWPLAAGKAVVQRGVVGSATARACRLCRAFADGVLPDGP